MNLGGVECVANDVAQDRVTIDSTLSDCRGAIFVLARKAGGIGFAYGLSSNGSFRIPLDGDCP